MSATLDAELLPTGTLRRRAGDSLTVFFICQTGTRSQLAAGRGREAGLSRVVHVDGGTNAWRIAGDRPFIWRSIVATDLGQILSGCG